MSRIACIVALVCLFGCSGESEPEPLVCEEVDVADFSTDSGWGSADYCSAPSDLGCFPWHESTDDVCGPFSTMRTSATTTGAAAACTTLITSLNCAEFASEDGQNRLAFHVADADRFTMNVRGTYGGEPVDTVFYFNPCHANCQAAVTLDTLAPDQQRICDIPRQGKPVCLFPDSAHSMTFVRADGGSMVIRTAGVETAMDRVNE